MSGRAIFLLLDRWEDMTLGLPYPRALHLSVTHAENLCVVLSRLGHPGHPPTIARAWLLGRRQEVECFVAHVTTDFRSRRLGEAAAARAIDTYLTALHKGLAVHFGERFPSCCAASSSPVPPVRQREEMDGTPPLLLRTKRTARGARKDAAAAEDLLAGLVARNEA
jgi:hypothetical protein